MDWGEYKTQVLRYRMEYLNTEEYIAILLLGIAEELAEYRQSIYAMKSIEKQLEEYGDLLWNIAELENILDGRNSDRSKNVNSALDSILDVSMNCIQAVRKHYFRDKDDTILIKKAGNILVACHIFFVNSEISIDAMNQNLIKMDRRHNK